jgi:hypothetical protein
VTERTHAHLATSDGAVPGTAEVVRFDLLGPPVLSRSAVLRDERLRYDVARQCAGWPSARLLVVDADGRVPIEWTGRAPEGPWGMDTDGTARLVTVPTTGDSPPEGAVLLGEAEGTPTGRSVNRRIWCRGRIPSAGRTCARPGPPSTRWAPACSPPPSPC